MKEIKPGYFLIAEYGQYAVIKRDTDFEPYVVAWCLQDDGMWEHGHYFSDLFDAVDYAKSQADEGRISYNRMSEIATKAIDGLFEDDSESAYEYCKDEIEMTEEEMDYFGVEKNMNKSFILDVN